jgi:hypothetical protein
VVLASDQNCPLGIAVDRTNLYWTDYDEGTIMKLPLAGGPPVAIATGQLSPEYIAVDATRVYWSIGASSTGGVGGIAEVPLAGGAPVQIAFDPTALHDSVVSDGSHVFWTSYQGGTVTRMAPDGSSPVTIASGQSGPIGVAVSATSVYWTNQVGGGVMEAPIGGGAPVLLVPGLGAANVAVNETSVYWSTGASLVKVSPSGAAPVMLATAPGDAESGGVVAVGETYVYWGFSDHGDGPILLEVPKGGGTLQPLVPGGDLMSVSAIAADASCVYWAEVGPSGPGSIMALAK